MDCEQNSSQAVDRSDKHAPKILIIIQIIIKIIIIIQLDYLTPPQRKIKRKKCSSEADNYVVGGKYNLGRPRPPLFRSSLPIMGEITPNFSRKTANAIIPTSLVFLFLIL